MERPVGSFAKEPAGECYRLRARLARFRPRSTILNSSNILLSVLVKRDGMSVTGAALHLGMAPSWGVKWHSRYLKEGIAGLQTRTRSGRPPRISGETLKAVKKK